MKILDVFFVFVYKKHLFENKKVQEKPFRFFFWKRIGTALKIFGFSDWSATGGVDWIVDVSTMPSFPYVRVRQTDVAFVKNGIFAGIFLPFVIFQRPKRDAG